MIDSIKSLTDFFIFIQRKDNFAFICTNGEKIKTNNAIKENACIVSYYLFYELNIILKIFYSFSN